MTEPMNTAEIAAMVAEIEAGTPGPWKADGPVWNQIVWTDGENRLCFMAHSNGLNDDRDIANARRIARVPAMEQTILALSAQLAAVTAERDDAAARVVTVEQLERWYSGYCADCNGWANARPEIRAIIERTPT